MCCTNYRQRSTWRSEDERSTWSSEDKRTSSPYVHPLATKQCHKIARHFEILYSPYNYEKIKKLAQKIVDGRHIQVDLKAYALCWAASNEIYLHRSIEDGEKLHRTAWEKVSTLECETVYC